jgi:AraC family transcriptional regulator, regulatory protein of adaptative response / methylated-DNA-[protein]-cysteine methyltransferase
MPDECAAALEFDSKERSAAPAGGGYAWVGIAKELEHDREPSPGDEGDTIRFTVGECSLGRVLVAMSDDGVRAIAFGDDPETLTRELRNECLDADPVADEAGLEPTLAEVVAFVENPARGLDLPLDARGTAFQQRVWKALRGIPAGSRASYGQIARRIGAPKEAYAVGEACAANVIALAIPCHRVVRKDGALAGYRWGFKRTRALLDREARA